MVHFSHITLPITILIVPFRKRFFFHFTGKKQTNKPDKPEWFLSRILSWIRDYRPFIIEWLGPVYKENCKRPIDSQVINIILILYFFIDNNCINLFVFIAWVYYRTITVCYSQTWFWFITFSTGRCCIFSYSWWNIGFWAWTKKSI